MSKQQIPNKFQNQNIKKNKPSFTGHCEPEGRGNLILKPSFVKKIASSVFSPLQ
jgi:hypothetical protein